MIIINSRFIFPKVVRVIIDTLFLGFFTYSINSNKEQEGPILDIAMSWCFFSYVGTLCSISMIRNYMNNYGQTFSSWLQVNEFKKGFLIYRVKILSYLFENFTGFLLTIFFNPVLNDISKNSTSLNTCLFFVFFSTISKIILLSFVSFLILIDNQRTSIRLHNQIYRISLVITSTEKDEGDICSICLDENNEKDWGELSCKHRFHIDCVNSWLVRSDSCPICRVSVL